MKNMSRVAIFCISVLLLVCAAGFVSAEEVEKHETNVTITGVVNENFQIVTEKEEVYEIGDTAEGDEVAKLVDKKVTVKGDLSTYEDTKFIMVESYEVVE